MSETEREKLTFESLKMISVVEAAKILDVVPDEVYKMTSDGKLRGFYVSESPVSALSRLFLYRWSVEEYGTSKPDGGCDE